MATKNCLSCRFEPKWRPVAGECWKQGIREMGIPRTTLYDRLSKLREAFSEAGLEDYL